MSGTFAYGIFAGLVLVIVAGALNLVSNKEQVPGNVPIPLADNGPVVLELFTSQGCSSCPPADHLLRELATDPEFEGKVIPLAFHVDYWNYLGWKDPFSNKKWTERQGEYVEAMGRSTMYTPQLVIHGRDELVGSKNQQVRRALKAQLSNLEAHQLKLTISNVSHEGHAFRGELKIESKVLEQASPINLIGIAFERGLATEIPRGENAGKTLENDFVVRNLDVLTQLQQKSNLDITQQFEIVTDNQASSDPMGLAIIAQEEISMKIVGAAVHF